MDGMYKQAVVVLAMLWSQSLERWPLYEDDREGKGKSWARRERMSEAAVLSEDNEVQR